jgi:hypothetical protein
MTTNHIDVILVEQLSSETPSHVDGQIKTNLSSNAHDLRIHFINIKNLSITSKHRRARNVLIRSDVSMTRKIQIAKYTAYLLVLLRSMLIFYRSRIFHSIPFSIRLLNVFDVFISIAMIISVLTIYYTASKSTSMLY